MMMMFITPEEIILKGLTRYYIINTYINKQNSQSHRCDCNKSLMGNTKGSVLCNVD